MKEIYYSKIKKGTLSIMMLTFIALLGLTGCSKEKRKANLKGIDFNMELGRFDKAFWNLDTVQIDAALEELSIQFPGMTDIYLERVLQFGSKDSAETKRIIKSFLAYTTVAVLYNAALDKYNDGSVFEKKLTEAFVRAHYFFP